MLRSDQSALQVQVDGEWRYVFCQSGGKVVSTTDRSKALPGLDLSFFQRYFMSYTFREELKEPKGGA